MHFCCCPEHITLAARQARWPDPALPWCITQSLPGVDDTTFFRSAEAAIAEWSQVCGLKPYPVNSVQQARLVIMVRRIDGPNGILAECELPMGQPQCRMWIDTSESWLTDYSQQQRGLILPVVIRHEAGHGIGLGHAPDGSANWMAPIYDPKVTRAGQWDTSESVQRYGRPAAQPPGPVPPSPPQPPTPGNPTMDRAKRLLAALEYTLAAFEAIAAITPSPEDDKIAATIRKYFDMVKKVLDGLLPPDQLEAKMVAMREELTMLNLQRNA